MRRKHALALIGLLCALALALCAALAEEDALFLPEDLGAVEVQAGGLTIEDSTLIDGLGDGDALSVPAALDLGELRFDDVPEAPAAQEAGPADAGLSANVTPLSECYDKEQFDAWYEEVKEKAKDADHILGPDGDINQNHYTFVFPGESIAVVPENAGLTDVDAKTGIMTFGFTIYQLNSPNVVTQYYGDTLLPRTGAPSVTELTAVETEVLHVPYRARDGIEEIDAESVTEVGYVSRYVNNTGLPIIIEGRYKYDNITSAGKMLGKGGSNGTYSFQGSGTIFNKPTFYFTENYYRLTYKGIDDEELYWPSGKPNLPDRIFIDGESHIYTLENPIRKGHEFYQWFDDREWGWDYIAPARYPRILEKAEYASWVSDGTTKIELNVSKYLLAMNSNGFLGLKDVALEPRFANPSDSSDCLTLGFNPQGGKINGKKYYICEAKDEEKRFSIDIGKLKPVRDGYKFIGWCTDPKNASGTLIKDTSPEKSEAWRQEGHTELYAVWESKNKTSIKKAKVTAISAKTYTGKAIKPNPVVKYNGKKLKKGTDYTVAYANNKNIGKATVTIKGVGKYKDSVKVTFNINPKAVSLASLTAGKGKLTAKWKKGTGGAGYQLQYSLKSTFASYKKVTIAKTATVSSVLKNLKSGKTYYVRIRAYKLVSGKAYVSAWSKALKAKVQ